ncbi:MAG: flagellar export chaperone FlgN [Planctomycetota bacterium]|nr:flagellar export chaperone FlgN [Planctomycetota bacterium]MCX8040277.1 flagellar export chaperone FlgN [Planctomycetota bacterium]MDW8372428.1 flagellar export chaperone FlgN [Planctomycetota bacterium]
MPPPPAPPAASISAALFEQLRRHLEQELACQQKLLGCAQELGHALTAADAAAITRVLAVHDAANREAATLAAQRTRLCQALASACRLAGELTLSSLLPHAPEALRAPLQRLRADLQQTCLQLQRLSERNLAVARSGLAVLRDAFGDSAGQRATSAYDRRGLIQAPAAPRGTLLNLRH